VTKEIPCSSLQFDQQTAAHQLQALHACTTTTSKHTHTQCTHTFKIENRRQNVINLNQSRGMLEKIATKCK